MFHEDFIDGAVTLMLPTLQAIATISILKKQKDLYDDIAEERIELIDDAVTKFAASVTAQISSGAFSAAYGSVPEAILYEEVDPGDEIKRAAEDSLRGLPAGKRHLEAANRIMEQEQIVRMMVLDARYVCDSELLSCTINDLLAGKLPVDDVIEVVKDGAEVAALNGRVGNTHNMTMRDLGISRLRAQREGQMAFQSRLTSLNADVAPLSKQVAVRDFLQTGSQRIAFALTTANLIQQSLQNEANADAAGDPTKFAELQAKLQMAVNVLGQEAQRGNMINQFVPNYAALVAPAIKSINEALLGKGDKDEDHDAGYKSGEE
jgi:hypothetical protein|tara:strand:+ start:2736 stop:3695 length:960 start_codon:yes stop_codon:yes gene_type:complete